MSDLARANRVKQERQERSGAQSKSPDWRPSERNARKFDVNACPRGWDADVWDLTLFWEQKREEYDHTGPGRPIIYMHLEDVVRRSGIRDRGYVDFENKLPGWVKVMRVLIAYFWDWEEEAATNPENCLSLFTQLPYFNETVDYLLRKAAKERRRQARLEEGN